MAALLPVTLVFAPTNSVPLLVTTAAPPAPDALLPVTEQNVMFTLVESETDSAPPDPAVLFTRLNHRRPPGVQGSGRL